MNSYQLLRPDSTPSGVWACGECHRPHLAAWRAGQAVAEWNIKAAEECCAPRNCRFCGKPTEREPSGRFPSAHEACVPKCEPAPPPHHSMAEPFARLLYEKMSALSQDSWCAGWLSGNEYMLWDVLRGERQKYGLGEVSDMDLEELRLLSKHADGWIWTGSGREHMPQLVTFAEWDALFAEFGKMAGRSEEQDLSLG